MADGLNVYGFASGDPVNFSDPFGLCADSLKNKKGLCPGGLTDRQYDRIEYAARNRMTREARDRILAMLRGGKFHAGFSLFNRLVHRGSSAVTNTLTGYIQLREYTFDYLIGDLAFLLAHESQHAVQPFLMLKPERDADAYGCANTWGRVGYEAGGYGNCGGR